MQALFKLRAAAAMVRHRRVEVLCRGTRTKLKTGEKPAGPRKTAIARLCSPVQRDIDDDAGDRQRVGVQSLGARLRSSKEVRAASRRHWPRGLKQAGRPAQLHHLSSSKTMVSLGYIRQEKIPSATASAGRCCAGRESARRRSKW